MPLNSIYDWIGLITYIILAIVALLGAFYTVLVWTRVGQKWFKSEEAQDAFLDSIEAELQSGNFSAVQQACEGDVRVLPNLIALGIQNQHLGYAKVKQLLSERFQRDVIASLEQNISWIVAIIKTAPMIGLHGTVTGMMGAFSTLSSQQSADPSKLAGDINLALYTTAIGLTIAIPLILALNAVSNRIRYMEELVGSGMTRFLEGFRVGLKHTGNRN